MGQQFTKIKNHLSQLIQQKEVRVAIAFTLFLIVFETIFFDVNYIDQLVHLYKSSGKFYQVLIALGIYLFTFVILIVVVWASLVSRPLLKILYLVILAIPLLVQYSYWNANQAFMALHDLDLTVELGGEAGPWKDHINIATTYLNLTALIPIGVYVGLLITVWSSYKRDFTLLIILFYGILFVNTGIFLYERSNTEHLGVRGSYRLGGIDSWNNFTQVITEAFYERLILYYIVNYYGPRQTVALESNAAPKNNIILIIDESVRADHLSMNGYKRSTTPYLEELTSNGLIYNWGVATSAATCSNQSVAALFTGVRDLPDMSYQVKLSPTIFQYAQSMGYRVILLDSEISTPRFHFSEDDYKPIDLFLGNDKFGEDYTNDTKMAQWTADLLSESVGNFVIILKLGLHFPYNKRYPIEQAMWAPVLPEEGSIIGDRERLVNSYDNAIRYNFENFFRTLLTDSKILDTTTILYTADHGQTLSDNGERYTHCKNTKKEAAVPLFMITSHDYPIDEQYRASHHNIFATLLDLMNFPEAKRRYDYAPSLLRVNASDAQMRYYLYGSLYGIGTYEVLQFDQN